MRSVSLAGCTGSIGTQALDILRAQPNAFRLHAIAADTSIALVREIAAEFLPDVVVIADEQAAKVLSEMLPRDIELRVGRDALASIVERADVVLNAVVGFAGLPLTMATLQAGKRLALANKESLVAAGPVVQRVRNTPGAELVPVDSEHAAIHQCLRAGRSDEVQRLVVTASGGPFRGRSAGELAHVTLAEALSHPTWTMGPKVTIDSSTLMNKGLEVIEAHELFAVSYDRIDVVVHPQSIVHSMVEYYDGSTVAQLSSPDMRLPIGYALGFPDRCSTPYGTIDWTATTALDFSTPDRATFRCLDLAYQAGRSGGTAPAWLNAANEVAVSAFCEDLLGWLAISDIVEDTLSRWDGSQAVSIDEVIDADGTARGLAQEAIRKMND